MGETVGERQALRGFALACFAAFPEYQERPADG